MNNVRVRCYVLLLVASIFATANGGIVENLDEPSEIDHGTGSIIYKSQAIGKREVGKILKHMKNTILGRLDLQLTGINANGIRKIANHSNFRNITHLILPNNNLKDDGAKAIAEVLKDTAIIEMNLSGNGIKQEGIKAIANVLKKSKITDIDLSNNVVGDETIETITNACEKIQRLNLRKTSISNPRSIFSALFDYPMTGLSIGENDLTERSVVTLAGILKFSKITDLEIGGIKITGDGTTLLAEGLKGSSVRFLDLTKNKLGDDGAEKIAKVLKDTAIQTLYLDENEIGERGGESIADVLKDTLISELTLENNNLQPALLERMRAQLTKNRIRNERIFQHFENHVYIGKVGFHFEFDVPGERSEASDMIYFTKIVSDNKGPWRKYFVYRIGGDTEIESFIEGIDAKLVKSLSGMEIDPIERVLLLLECEENGLKGVVRHLIRDHRSYYCLRDKVPNEPHELDGILHPAVYIIVDRYWPFSSFRDLVEGTLKIFQDPKWDVFIKDKQLGTLAENYGKVRLLKMIQERL